MTRRIIPTPKQKGMATVLIVLLVGVSMTAVALGLAGSVKSSQKTQTAVHAVTHAQSAAWAAVHMFQNYLNELAFEDVEQLVVDSEVPISVTGMPQGLNITIVEVDTSKKLSEGIFVTANIRAHDSSADSTTIIQVVYQVENKVCDLCQVLNGTINLFDDTELGGDITIATDPGAESTVYVEGDVNAKNIAFKGVTRLNATGDVVLGSAIPLKEVYTNGNLTLDGAANVEKASAVGGITTLNNGYADLMYANNAISLGGGAVAIANSRSNISITNWAIHGELHSGADVVIASPVQKVRAKGNVQQAQWADARDIETEGNMTCPGTSWGLFDSIIAKGSLTNCPSSSNVKGNTSVTIAVMEELQPFEQVQPRVDAWAVKASANYVFEYTLGKVKVTVKNVNSVADGTYFLGNYPDVGTTGYRDYLCDAVDGSGKCTLPITPYKTVCNSYSTTNNCITYSNSTKTWSVDGRNLAPGVVWFDGNLILSNGRYYNTFITTGDLATSNDHETAAPNYIGYDAICANAYPKYPSSRFAGMYPTQLCDISAGAMKYEPLANIAYLAGGFNPNAGGVFKGGNINLDASNAVYGSILAGNNLDTFGDIRVYGYVTAAAQNSVASENNFGGKTIIDISNLPPTYRPQELPNFDTNSCVSACNPPPSGPIVLWTRYL